MTDNYYRILSLLLSLLIGVALIAVLWFRLPGTTTPGNPLPTFLTIPDFELVVEHTYVGSDPTKCEAPKPDDIGCTTICKPCITWLCIGGEWVREDIENPDEICQPRPNLYDPFDQFKSSSASDRPSACPRTDNGFCPTQCNICF